jgi:hypothetical protein
VSRFIRPWAALPLAVFVAFAVAACGSSSKNSSTAASGGSTPASGGATPTVNMVEGTFPQSLDPGKDYTSQGFEVNWIVYTGLMTYAHANG